MKRACITGWRTGRLACGIVFLIGAMGAFAAVGSGPAEDISWLAGNWLGERCGHSVTWRFGMDGRMRLEGRGATWSVRNDTLVVDLDALGKNERSERAVYRFLTSNPQQGRRLLFLRGFDLGADGLLLRRQEPGAPTNRAGSMDTGGANTFGDVRSPATPGPPPEP